MEKGLNKFSELFIKGCGWFFLLGIPMIIYVIGITKCYQKDTLTGHHAWVSPVLVWKGFLDIF